jgi:hypothetical protein
MSRKGWITLAVLWIGSWVTEPDGPTIRQVVWVSCAG